MGTGIARPLTQSHIIKRPRLLRLIDESDARIVLLVAPAGYGKTTLARQWVEWRRCPAAWYTATDTSADVAFLATGLAAEIDRLRGDDELTRRIVTMTAVHQHPLPLAEAVLDASRELPRGAVLVLDDYHLAERTAASAALLRHLIQRLDRPVVITSRLAPTWLEARLEVYREVLLVGVDQLSMSDDEAADVVRGSAAEAVSIASVAKGWPAAIGLAAQARSSNTLTNPLSRPLYEYLARDLLEVLSDAALEGLTAIALTAASDLPSAEYAAGGDAAATVREAASLGLVGLENDETISLHPLLREVLLKRLREMEPRERAAVVEAVSSRLLGSGWWDGCLALVNLLPRVELVQYVIKAGTQELLATGRIPTLERWVSHARSLGVIDGNVDLADGEISFRLGQAARALSLAIQAAQSLPDSDDVARAEILAGRAADYLGLRTRAREYFRSAATQASVTSLRSLACWGEVTVAWDEDENLAPALERFASTIEPGAARTLRLSQGRLLHGIATGTITDSLAEADFTQSVVSLVEDPIVATGFLNQYAYALVLAARYADSLRITQQQIELAVRYGLEFARSHARLTQGSALVGLRRFSSAQRLLTEITHSLEEAPDNFLETNLALQRTRLRISLGDFRGAYDLMLLDPDLSVIKTLRAEHHAYKSLTLAALREEEAAGRYAALAESLSTRIEVTALANATRAVNAVLTRHRGWAQEARARIDTVLTAGGGDAVVLACRVSPDLAAVLAQDTTMRDPLIRTLTASR